MGLTSIVAQAEMNMRMNAMQKRIAEFEAKLAQATGVALQATLRANAAEKIQQGANLTRPEAAAYLGVSTRKLQRMETAGHIRRCPKMGSSVLFAARDVQRIASATGKER